MVRRGGGVAVGPAPAEAHVYELECLPGLEGFVVDEVGERLGCRVRRALPERPGRVQVYWHGGLARVATLRSVVAAHLLLRFDVPRPKALMGHEHFTRLTAAVNDVLRATPGGFATMKLSAAGADSAVMQRFRRELAAAVGLQTGDDRADLLVSVRRPADGAAAWEVLLRTTPRPLSARGWRVCHMPGALNATVAYAMARLATGDPDARLVNMACGSGTLMVEYLGCAGPGAIVGIDRSAEAIGCAQRNLAAAGHDGRALLVQGDAAHMPLPDGWADVLLVDLPFGMLVGSAEENERLYPALLLEAARVARPGARLVAITTAGRAFLAAISGLSALWSPQRSLRVDVPYAGGYLRPAIYVLGRTGGRPVAGARGLGGSTAGFRPPQRRRPARAPQ